MVHQNLGNTMVHLMFLVNQGGKIVLGLPPMVSGNSEIILSGLKEILQKIETVCG